MNYLLDTCVVSELVKNSPSRPVVEWIGRQEECRLFLSAVTLGEIRKGISLLAVGRKHHRLERWLEDDLKPRFRGRILSVDAEVAQQWGALAADAQRKGRPLPVLDGLLAATALVGNLVLVTRNAGHVETSGAQVFDPWAM